MIGAIGSRNNVAGFGGGWIIVVVWLFFQRLPPRSQGANKLHRRFDANSYRIPIGETDDVDV